MKLFFIFSFLLVFTSCSFDNKTGIWKNENDINVEKDKNIFKDFEKISSEAKYFNEIISVDKNYKFNVNKPFPNSSWKDVFYNKNNNLINFEYNNLNTIIHKSKKLSKNKISSYKLFENNNLIFNDKKGNLIIYSPEKSSTVSKYNFYKKRYKNINKNLNLVADNNIIFVSDNIGYIYAYDYLKDKIIWAKNYKIPFLSNIKMLSEKIIVSNQNNDLYILDKLNGNLIKQIPSENTKINNLFRNNISLNNESIFFLNTYGSLYSIDQERLTVNWFINLNSSLNLNLSNLFFGGIIVNNGEQLVISANKNFYIVETRNGSIIAKKNFSTKIRPLIIKKHVFLITDNNLLISLDLESGDIIYSHDINDKVAKFTDTKKKNLSIKNIQIADNQIFIFLENSYVIKLSILGEIIDILKLPSKLQSDPIFVDSSMYYLSKKNKLYILN